MTRLTKDAFLLRIKLEIAAFDDGRQDIVSATPNGDDFRKWSAEIKGVSDTPYEGGVFKFEINLTSQYPFKPPIVKVLTKIYHPNFQNDCVCVDILDTEWLPSMLLIKLLQSISILLSDPNPLNSLNVEAGQIYVRDRAQYNRIVKDWTQKYAINTEEIAPESDSSDSSSAADE